MDIIAHGLWAGAAYKGVNKIRRRMDKKPLSALWGAFWGAFPDLVAFTPLAIWIAGSLAFGTMHFSDLNRHEASEPPTGNGHWMFQLTHFLYSLTHSGVVFVLVFLFSWTVIRRPIWELGGWLLHILLDIPTHSYKFYPTPVFWPLSGWEFKNGFSWATPWFIILNYSLILITYILLRNKKKVVA